MSLVRAQQPEPSIYKYHFMWYFIFMREFASDELYLCGRMQIETAIGALAHTGANPDAQARLQTFLDVHGQLSDGESQNDLSVYLQGGTVEREKAHIIAALDLLKSDESVVSSTRIAAAALREIL
jgi:hypothetical protein